MEATGIKDKEVHQIKREATYEKNKIQAMLKKQTMVKRVEAT